MRFLTKENEFEFLSNLFFIYFYHSKLPRSVNKFMVDSFIGVKIESLAIDVDAFPEFIKRFGLSQVPTVLFFNDKKEIKRFEGLAASEKIKEFVEKH